MIGRQIAAALLGLTIVGTAEAGDRWVTLGASTTELVFALGKGASVVGVDGTSVYPAAADALPEVGTHRDVHVEAVLALRPTRVIASDAVGQPAVLDQLRAAGVPVDVLPEPHDLDAARARVRAVAALVGAVVEGEALVKRLDAELATLRAAPGQPRVAFVYARGVGTMMIGGGDMAVATLVRLAGGTLVSDWAGFRPVTPESLVAAAPDVLVLTTRGLDSVGGVDALLAVPGVALTPAGKARRVVVLDDLLLLTLGPRTGEAARQLAARLGGAP